MVRYIFWVPCTDTKSTQSPTWRRNLKRFMAVCDDYEIRRGGFTEDDLRRAIKNIGEGFDGVCRQKHLPVGFENLSFNNAVLFLVSHPKNLKAYFIEDTKRGIWYRFLDDDILGTFISREKKDHNILHALATVGIPQYSTEEEELNRKSKCKPKTTGKAYKRRKG